MNENSDELTRACLDRWCIEWRLLETHPATTECTLFGKKLSTPILLGGMAHYDRLQPGGAPEYAKAAKEAGTAVWTGMCRDQELEAVLAVGAPAARIVKPFADEQKIFAAIEHDAKAGACAFAMDIDHAYNKTGGYDSFGREKLTSYTRSQLAEFARHSTMPIFIKGVTSVKDAVLCAEAGVAGIVLSHHQNMFPWTVPPIRVLPEIRAAVGKGMSILVDGGLNSGYDVFKALALGADGVFVVRQMIPLFREGGSAAVAQRLQQMTDELRVCLSRTGAENIDKIDRTVLREM